MLRTKHTHNARIMNARQPEIVNFVELELIWVLI